MRNELLKPVPVLVVVDATTEPGLAFLLLLAALGALYLLTILLAPGIAMLIALAVVCVKVVGAARRRGRTATESNNLPSGGA